MPLRTYLPAALALLVAVAAIASIEGFAHPAAPQVSPTASTTESAPAAPAPSSAAASSEASNAGAPAASAPSEAELANRALTASGANLLKSTVNILCVPDARSGLRGISGSGVIIDSRGLILTAAHIGQYFLLRDYPRPDSIACVIRTGGPAEDAYTAELAYISPSWIADNPDTISENTPTGTGEDDFAILAITGSATGAPLPSSFPSVPLADPAAKDPAIGEHVAIGAYAAQYLGTEEIEDDLYPTIVFDPITDRFTFGENTVDVISVTGTPAAQEGSSGGGIADASGHLIGEITTSTVAGDVSEHTLNAITPRHIRASFAADAGENLDSYLSSNSPSALVADFAPTAAKLAQFLIAANR